MDSDWASLPLNVLDSILEKIISIRDYLHFEVVCSSWQSVAKSNINQRVKSLGHEVPLLMIPSEEDNHLHDLYDITTNKLLESKLVVPSFHRRFSGSCLGWLVSVNKDLSVTLYKPHSMADHRSTTSTIHLPPLFHSCELELFENLEYGVSKAVISADPLRDPNKCIVMVMCGFDMRLAYIRPSDTKPTWSYTYIDEYETGVCVDIMYYKDLFYALSITGKLISFEVTGSFELIPKLIVSEESETTYGNRYLVELNGKLMHVDRDMHFTYSANEIHGADLDEDDSDDERERVIADLTSRETEEVIVYELDNDGKCWNEIEGTGDFALFLGDNSSMSVLASNFPGCKPNCIYFTHDQDGVLSSNKVVRDFGVYDLESDIMDLDFNMDEDSREKISMRVPIWFVPYVLKD